MHATKKKKKERRNKREGRVGLYLGYAERIERLSKKKKTYNNTEGRRNGVDALVFSLVDFNFCLVVS